MTAPQGPAAFEKLDRMRRALAACSFLPGCAHKRFARAIVHVPIEQLTERQRRHLVRLCWRYRRQMPWDLVPSKDAVEAIDSAWQPQQVAGMTVHVPGQALRPVVYNVSRRRVLPPPETPPLLARMEA